MLNLLTPTGYTSLDVEYSVVHLYSGYKRLLVEVPTAHPLYKYILEENHIVGEGQRWNIKGVNVQGDITFVECALDMDALKVPLFTSYNTETLTLEDTLEPVLTDTGWTLINAVPIIAERSLDLTDVNSLQIVDACPAKWDFVYEIDTLNKTLTTRRPQSKQWEGLYITEQANLRSVDLKGDSYELITRLYPFGAIDEETGEALSILSVNDGVAYIDNNDYTSKIISAVWRDERYTDAQSLKDATIEKLKETAWPARCYELEVANLAALDPTKYSVLAMALYDLAELIDINRGTKSQLRIVEYQEFPRHRESDIITLSTVVQRIEALMNDNFSSINDEIIVNKTKVNELTRTVDGLTSRVAETYTIGETDYLLQTQISQSSEEIRTEVEATYATKSEVDSLETVIDQNAAEVAIIASRRGGDNLVLASGWIITGAVSTPTDNATASRKTMLCGAGSALQRIAVQPNTEYTLSFMYLKNTSTAYLKRDGTYVLQSSETQDTYAKVAQSFITSPGQYELELEFGADGSFCNFADIALNSGTNSDWTQNPNEIESATMTVRPDGMRVRQAAAETQTIIDAEGLRVTELEDEQQVVARYDKEGVIAKSVRSEGRSTAGRFMLIPDDTNGAVHFVISD